VPESPLSVDPAGLAQAGAATLAFVAVLFVASRLVPARSIDGAADPEGRKDTYVLNGLALFLLVAAGVAAAQLAGADPLGWIHAHFLELLVAANAFAFAASLTLFAAGRKGGEGFKGFIQGVSRNPRLWGVDLKLFSYRPSLIGLALVNASFAAVQYERHGMLSDAMLLYQALTFLYVLNYFQFEYGMVFTWDIIAERFGWMLVWGDYVLVPFFYSLVGWFVIDRTEPLPASAVGGLCLLFAFGFWLFRGANEQKHRFRLDPGASIWGRPAEALGGRLLVSGFWGIGRHLNYTGEICIYLAFTLTAGFAEPWPYLLPLWLTSLLVHRAWRDERRCRDKYGPLWSHYVRCARFRMLPLVY